MRLFGTIGAFSLLLSVAFGAFGAHALRDHLSERMREVFETGVRYQLIHSLAIVVISLLAGRGVLFTYAGWLYVAGIILFSFSLYLLAITGVRWLGMITPLGGLSFIAGHALLIAAFFRLKSS
ncbi:MAG TPA: DUF423 domain-containing protein [Acidobacteriota bacterium]|nr:DUF423 domain-containing protein [Acidobacteriota bacterium]